jgi:hypothetical protein
MLDNQTALALGAVGLGLFFWYGVLPAAIIVVVWREYRSNPLAGLTISRLALRKFIVNESGAPAVDIVGRPSGFFGWVFTVLKLDPESRFLLDDQQASFQSASLSGLSHIYVPLEKVTSTCCIYRRSIMALGVAAYCGLSFIGSLMGALGFGLFVKDNSNAFGVAAGGAFIWLILGAIAAAWFFLSKQIAIVVRSGATGFGFLFKRSVIENVSIDLPEALATIAVVNARVAAAQVGGRQAPGTGSATILARQCPKCAASNALEIRFCESCGFGLA